MEPMLNARFKLGKFSACQRCLQTVSEINHNKNHNKNENGDDYEER